MSKVIATGSELLARRSQEAVARCGHGLLWSRSARRCSPNSADWGLGSLTSTPSWSGSRPRRGRLLARQRALEDRFLDSRHRPAEETSASQTAARNQPAADATR